MKTKTLLSTAYFPNLTYCRHLCRSNEVLIDTGEHFVKQSQRNRCMVVGPNKVLNLIVPLKKWKNNTPVKDIQIAYEENWQKLHWKTLEACYRSSPYFEYYEDKFNRIIREKKFRYLVELNEQSLAFIVESLNITAKISLSENYIEAEEAYTDYRTDPSLLQLTNEGFEKYIQVFSPNESFVGNLSFIDLICNEGPNAIHLLS